MPAMSEERRAATISAILESLEKGSTISASCGAAGINPFTFRKWRKADKGLEDDVQGRLLAQIDVVEGALYTQALKGNVRAQMFFLCNRASDRWQALSRIVHDVTVDGESMSDLVKRFAERHGGGSD